MGFHFCDPFTLEVMPLPLWYARIGYAPAPRLPRAICPRCYGSGVEYVPNSLGIERPLPCVCEQGHYARRQMIASIAHDTLYLPVERQMDALGAEARGEAWRWRSELEADWDRERADLRVFAVQGL